MNPVDTLESRYLPMLTDLAIRIRERHPTFTVKVGSGPVGRATSFQGHHVYLECYRLESVDPEPNCIALELCMRDLLGTPKLCSLGVTWGGDGTPPSEGMEWLEEDVAFGQNAIDEIDEALPQLQEHLEGCLFDWESTYRQSA